MACCDVSPAFPAEILPTLCLETCELLVLTGNDQVRSVLFMTGRFPFKYGQCVYVVKYKDTTFDRLETPSI